MSMNWGRIFLVLGSGDYEVKLCGYSIHSKALEIQHMHRIAGCKGIGPRVLISHWGFVPLGWTEGTNYDV